jgi:uncharacterized protein
MKKDLQNILSLLKDMNPFLQKEFNVNSIEVFGSYAKKNQTSRSDLDLLVSFSKTPGLIKFIELENTLSEKLGIKVDLVMKDSIKPRLRNSILSTVISI